MRFVIKGKMPSLNEVIDVTRRNKFAGARQKAEIQQDIELQIYQQIRENNLEKYLPLKNIADFRFEYTEKNQKRDKDNIASCKKFLFDALVRRGVINNDGWKEINVTADVSSTAPKGKVKQNIFYQDTKDGSLFTDEPNQTKIFKIAREIHQKGAVND